MANDLNKVTLIGRLTRDPELKTIGETQVANFSLAVGKTYMSNGQKKDETYFFDCVVWGKLADVLQKYSGKGKQIAVDGKLEQQTWDGQDGKKSKVIIRVDNFQLLGSNPNSNSQDPQESENVMPPPDDDSVF